MNDCITEAMDASNHTEAQGKIGDCSANDLKASFEIKCPMCKLISSMTIDDLLFHQRKQHMRELRGKFEYKCNLCSHGTKVMDHMRKHLMRHYDIKPFKCDKCDWTCVTRHQLTVHGLKHLNLKRKRLRR